MNQIQLKLRGDQLILLVKFLLSVEYFLLHRFQLFLQIGEVSIFLTFVGLLKKYCDFEHFVVFLQGIVDFSYIGHFWDIWLKNFFLPQFSLLKSLGAASDQHLNYQKFVIILKVRGFWNHYHFNQIPDNYPHYFRPWKIQNFGFYPLANRRKGRLNFDQFTIWDPYFYCFARNMDRIVHFGVKFDCFVGKNGLL